MTSQAERLPNLTGGDAVVGEADLAHVLRRLVAEARSATGARYAALAALGPRGALIDFINEGPSDEADGPIPQSRGALSAVAQDRETIVLDDAASRPDFPAPADGRPTSFLGVPVLTGEVVFGALHLHGKPGGFNEGDVALTEALAVIAGAAVGAVRRRERVNVAAVAEDRNRIARDLHDSVIQDLFAVGLSLQGLSQRLPESGGHMLDSAVDQLHNAVETLRKYIYELRAADDRRQDLAWMLDDLAERMGSAYPTRVSLKLEGDVGGVELGVSEEVMKLVTEAVSNALRHSRAEEVAVDATRDPAGLTISISDDGSGFDVETVDQGLGLVNMAERTRRLGGGLDIETTPGSGTVVSISLPGL